MKSTVVLMLTLGIVGALAKPKQLAPESVPNNNKKCDTEHKSEESAIFINNNGLASDTAINEIPIEIEKGSNYGASIDILMEESIGKPADTLLDIVEEPNIDSEFPIQSDDMYSDVINKDPNEIMDTAAGFVPIPIFRNKQKAKRRFATRRQFKRKPYSHRRIFFLYPSYGFYPYSSLGYY